jgi:hypothetical protein
MNGLQSKDTFMMIGKAALACELGARPFKEEGKKRRENFTPKIKLSSIYLFL